MTRQESARGDARPWLRAGVLRVLTAALGVLLLVLAVTTSSREARETAVERVDHDLTTTAVAQAAQLGEYFERARSINLILARDQAFSALAPSNGEPGELSEPALAKAGAAIAFLESLYPDKISEACLIALDGRELVRVTDGQVAAAEDLSADESGAPFFEPTTRLGPEEVHQSAPYVSPDTGQRVISNSSLVTDAAGEPWAIMHFEVALDSFGGQAVTVGTDRQRPTASAGLRTMVVDGRTGRVVLVDGVAQPLVRPAETASDELMTALATVDGVSNLTVDGRRTTVASVTGTPNNQNSWYVVVSAAPLTFGFAGLGAGAITMILAALMLLVFALTNLVSSTRGLREASLTDELTGLPNLRLLTDRLDQALLMARRRQNTCAVMLIDLDRFKEVNDTLGHHHGDVLLQGVADRLKSALRASDTVARLGGDEFAVLLPEVADEDAAVALASRCLDALHATFMVEGVALNVEASVGLALAPRHGDSGHALLRAADVAMYDAKERRCGTVVYDAGTDLNTPSRLALLGDLRRAIQSDDLFMHYQPKIDLVTNEMRSVEALVRWQHPTRGAVPPIDFVPIAEGTGLMMPLTLRTLDLTIAQGRRWVDAGRHIQVAVNLSPRCLLDLDFPEAVADLLEEHGLPAHLLRLEVTENTFMNDPNRALAVLASLRSIGISLSIDDFGTGYSSMSYLKRLPVDELKIDRTFITEMLRTSHDDVLVRSSIDLAHNLGMSVVAEGVEDQETVDALLALGCDVVQGYHLGRPMSAEDLDVWLDVWLTSRPETVAADHL